jgi:hypothetical protein
VPADAISSSSSGRTNGPIEKLLTTAKIPRTTMKKRATGIALSAPLAQYTWSAQNASAATTATPSKSSTIHQPFTANSVCDGSDPHAVVPPGEAWQPSPEYAGATKAASTSASAHSTAPAPRPNASRPRALPFMAKF